LPIIKIKIKRYETGLKEIIQMLYDSKIIRIFRYKYKGHPLIGRAFTLMELLVVIGVIAMLMGILLPVLGKARQSVQTVSCSSKLRQIGTASSMYAEENDGYFARSSHSASVYGCLRWGPAFMPYLADEQYKGMAAPSWENVLKGAYHCPSDGRKPLKLSYGKNVWFELESFETGEVFGSEEGPTYRILSQVPNPSAAVEFGELLAGMGDHFMANTWIGALTIPSEVDAKRHGRAANYSYLDGHVEALEFKKTFDASNPGKIIDNWNPGTAQ
jgi:prepilin-type processing-associated H-X9-DG protein/prepilin-type N-terminal cleavage/methylation domain-containing protein